MRTSCFISPRSQLALHLTACPLYVGSPDWTPRNCWSAITVSNDTRPLENRFSPLFTTFPCGLQHGRTLCYNGNPCACYTNTQLFCDHTLHISHFRPFPFDVRATHEFGYFCVRFTEYSDIRGIMHSLLRSLIKSHESGFLGPRFYATLHSRSATAPETGNAHTPTP